MSSATAGKVNEMFEISTIGLIQSAHDGLALAETVNNDDPELATRISNACETLLSTAALVLRWERAQVPLDVADSILLVSGELTKARASKTKAKSRKGPS